MFYSRFDYVLWRGETMFFDDEDDWDDDDWDDDDWDDDDDFDDD